MLKFVNRRKELSLLFILLLTACRNTNENAYLNIVKKELVRPYLSTVEIIAFPGTIIGTGVIITKQRDRIFILTANHVAEDEPFLIARVIFPNKKAIFIILRPVALDSHRDLALLESLPMDNLPNIFADFANKLPKLGERVYAIGSHAGDPHVVTSGIISKYELVKNVFYGKTDCHVFNGNSGGGIFNKHGEFIGIVVSGEYSIRQYDNIKVPIHIPASNRFVTVDEINEFLGELYGPQKK